MNEDSYLTPARRFPNRAKILVNPTPPQGTQHLKCGSTPKYGFNWPVVYISSARENYTGLAPPSVCLCRSPYLIRTLGYALALFDPGNLPTGTDLTIIYSSKPSRATTTLPPISSGIIWIQNKGWAFPRGLIHSHRMRASINAPSRKRAAPPLPPYTS